RGRGPCGAAAGADVGLCPATTGLVVALSGAGDGTAGSIAADSASIAVGTGLGGFVAALLAADTLRASASFDRPDGATRTTPSTASRPAPATTPMTILRFLPAGDAELISVDDRSGAPSPSSGRTTGAEVVSSGRDSAAATGASAEAKG